MRYASGANRCIQLLGRTNEGKPFGLVVDVTERKKFEESIQKAKVSKKVQQQAERITELEDITVSQHQEINARKVIETELKQSLRRQKLTKHLIQLMSRSFEVDQILQIASREIGSFFGADRCQIIQYEKEAEAHKGLWLSAHLSSLNICQPVCLIAKDYAFVHGLKVKKQLIH